MLPSVFDLRDSRPDPAAIIGTCMDDRAETSAACSFGMKADDGGRLFFRVRCEMMPVLLPESFRGGRSFGAVAPMAASGLSRHRFDQTTVK